MNEIVGALIRSYSPVQRTTCVQRRMNESAGADSITK
jgi:hypothetical protein